MHALMKVGEASTYGSHKTQKTCLSFDFCKSRPQLTSFVVILGDGRLTCVEAEIKI